MVLVGWHVGSWSAGNIGKWYTGLNIMILGEVWGALWMPVMVMENKMVDISLVVLLKGSVQ